MKKKMISILLCAMLAVSLLSGCVGAKENPETEETTVSEEVTEETQEEESSSESSEESTEDDELNFLGLTGSDMEIIYSDMEEALQNEYLEPNNMDAKDFSFPEDFECWRYFASHCMCQIEEPDSSEERIQSYASALHPISSENQTIMTIAAKSYYNSVKKIDEDLWGIKSFVTSEGLIEEVQELLTSNVFAD